VDCLNPSYSFAIDYGLFFLNKPCVCSLISSYAPK